MVLEGETRTKKETKRCIDFSLCEQKGQSRVEQRDKRDYRKIRVERDHKKDITHLTTFNNRPIYVRCYPHPSSPKVQVDPKSHGYLLHRDPSS